MCVPNSGGGSYEVFSPDKSGDANSTEQQYFYETPARSWPATSYASGLDGRVGGDHQPHRQDLPSGNTTPSAVRTDAVSLSNATFDQYGFPIAANGFARVDASNLQYNGTNAIDADYELVVSPLNG